MAALTFQMFSTTDGAIYHILTQIFGSNAPDLLSDPKLFPALIVGQNIWKETGYGTIIYLAALSSVDVQLYEAAKIDGAGRWQLMWHVTLPAIRGTIVLMLIMKVGQLLNTSYEQIFLMQNSMNAQPPMCLTPMSTPRASRAASTRCDRHRPVQVHHQYADGRHRQQDRQAVRRVRPVLKKGAVLQ